MGKPVRRLSALLSRKARGRGYRQDLLHPRFLQVAGCRPLCLQRLCEPVRQGSGLRPAHAGKCPHPELVAAELRLQAGGGGPRSLLVASADFRRPQYGSRSRRLGARAGAGNRERDRGRRPRGPHRAMAGAAVQANILGGGSKATEDMLLLDVTPLSLGIEALGGVVAKIIQRNSTIPASASESFTTGVDGQTNVAIHVLQGEREMAKDCRSLARFDLKGIPPMSAGLPRIEVKFLIDANGILHVSALEQRSGKQAEVSVKPAYGLTDEQVESMILESFDHAEEDIHLRQLVEARNEAETILSAVEKAPSHPAWQLLDPDEQAEIGSLSAELSVLKQGDDLQAL